jgi:hypothetical protein
MIERSADALEHNQFKDVIVRAANVEMYVAFLHSTSLAFKSVLQLLQGSNLVSSRTPHPPQ